MLEMSSIDKEEGEIKFSSKEALRFNIWQNKVMKNEPLNFGQHVAEFYKTLVIKLDDKEKGECKK